MGGGKSPALQGYQPLMSYGVSVTKDALRESDI